MVAYNLEYIWCQCNKALWDTGSPDAQNKARNRKARTQYAFNILVVNDKMNPDNNGKVFVYKCGPAIFQMIMDAMNPQQEFGEEPKKPFDVYEGNNLILRGRKDPTKNGMITYDKSKFEDKSTPISESDVELERIYNSMQNLDEFVNRGRLSEEKVMEKAKAAYCTTNAVALVFGNSYMAPTPKTKPVADQDPFSPDDPFGVEPSNSELPPWETPSASSASSSTMRGSEEDSTDDLAFFKSLANS